MFVTFEGPEGSGKTTQIQLLADVLLARGQKVLTTREPGGTRIGNAIRALLLDSDHSEMNPRAEALLFNAARAQLVDEVILPALADDVIVLCDRYSDSTLAYQGYGHRQSIEELRALGAFATTGLTPDLTIFLDIDVEAGLQRKRDHCADVEWNRMEEQTLVFHHAVRHGYLKLAAAAPARWLVLDAAGPVDAVQLAILDRLLPLVPAKVLRIDGERLFSSTGETDEGSRCGR